MTWEQQFDTLLDFIRKNEGISYDILLHNPSLKGITFITCFNKLKKDGYIFQEKGTFDIKTTAEGKHFHEQGGYSTVSNYSKRTLNLSIANNRLMWASVIISLIGLILACIAIYLQVNSGANNVK